MATIHNSLIFRQKIMSLLLDPYWSYRFASLMNPDFFETSVERDVVKAIKQYKEAYNKPPADPLDLLSLLDEDEKYDEYVYDLYDMGSYETQLASDVAIQFIREQQVKIAILESIEDVERGKMSEVVARIKQAVEVGELRISTGMDLINDSVDWLSSLWTDKISTGWPHVDAYIEGGLAGGELGLIMSPSNRGKTMALVNIGYGAAQLGSAKKIVHWTGEISTNVVAKRYAARMIYRFIKRGDNIGEYRKELLNKAKRFLPGQIRIIGGYRITLSVLENQLDAIRDDGYDFDEVIVDYPDLLLPERRYNDKRYELSDIAGGLREMAKKYDVPIWGATQSNRGSYNKETIDLEDIAEDIGKVNIADVIVTLSQTKEEWNENRCRLHMPKVRDGDKVISPIYAKYYPKSQAIVTIGE